MISIIASCSREPKLLSNLQCRIGAIRRSARTLGQRSRNAKLGSKTTQPIGKSTSLLRLTSYTVGFAGICYGCASIYNFEQKKYNHRRSNFYNDEMYFSNFNLSVGQKTTLAVIGTNIAIFCFWRIPRLHNTMVKYFFNNMSPKTSVFPSMILSNWSHIRALHLTLNMYVLYNFSPYMIDKLFRSSEHFLAFYLTAGTVSSLASLAAKQYITGTAIGSLGASGAILACLTYTCYHIPDAKLNIIFLPMITFTAYQAIFGILAFDAVGLALRFTMFDHAAHLGGSLFGLWYARYGEQICWGIGRQKTIDVWRKFTKS